MGSYFVVLHSTPEGAGDTRRKFILELAKRLGRKEADLNILLSDLPAVVTASPTKDFAESLCLAIENLGGLAEMMAEVSGIHASLGAGAEKPKAKAPAPPLENIEFSFEEKNESLSSLAAKAKPEPAKPQQPAAAASLDLSFDETASFPPRPTAPAAAAAAPEDFTPPDTADVEQLLEEALKPPAGEIDLTLGPVVEPTAAPAAEPKADAEPSKEAESPKDADKPKKRPKSRGSMTVISAFQKSSASSPPAMNQSAQTPAPKSDALTPEEIVEPGAAAAAMPGTPPPRPKRHTKKQKALFALLGLTIVLYVTLLIKPDLIIQTETGMTISRESINKLLKQQEQILTDLQTKPELERQKVLREWTGDEISGQGSLRVALGSTEEHFDAGRLELSTPEAARLSPEEYSRGVSPRIWIKELVIEKLRKTGQPDELTGKAKVTIADERVIDKVIASTIVKVTKTENPEVVTGTIEIFFPLVTHERPAEDIMARDGEGQVRLYHKRIFTARAMQPEDKPVEKRKGAAQLKKDKPLQIMPEL